MTSLLREMMQSFEPVSLITAISAMSIYPANTMFLARFRFLIAKVASIKSFSQEKKATFEDVLQLLEAIPDEYQLLFASVEDFVPHNLFDEVFICLKGVQKRFFYADLERPLATVEGLVTQAEIVSPYFRQKDEYDLNAIVDFMLTYQDYLIRAIIDYAGNFEGPVEPATTIQKPPDTFLDFWRSISFSQFEEYQSLSSDKKSLRRWKLLNAVKCGDDKTLKIEFATPFILPPFLIEVSGHLLMPLPQLGIESLQYQIKYTITKLNRNKQEKLRDELYKYAFREGKTWVALLFGLEYTLPNTQIVTKDEKLQFPFVARADDNKLVVYQFAIGLGTQNELDVSVNVAIKQFLALEETFQSNTSVLVKSKGWGDPVEFEMATSRMELIHILIVYEFGFEENLLRIENVPTGCFLAMRDASHKSLAQECRGPSDFVNFAHAWQELDDITEIGIIFNILDAFEIYRDHGYSFNITKEIPSFVMFDPHAWSESEHERLVNQKHWRELRCVLEIPDYVLFREQNESIEYFDPFNDHVWSLVSSKNRSKSLSFQLRTRFTSRDIFELNHALVEGFKFRLDGWGEAFWEFCSTTLNFSLFVLEVYFVTYEEAKSDERFEQAIRHFDRDNSQYFATEILIKGSRKLNPVIVMIYQAEQIQKGLIAEDNELERNFTVALLKAIADAHSRLSEYVIIQVHAFVEKHLAKGTKSIGAFAIRALSISPRRIEPFYPVEADFAWIKTKVARHLFTEKVLPNEYFAGDAIKLFTETVYPFLISLLDKFLATYDCTDLLVRSYKLLEETESYKFGFKQLTAAHAAHALLDYDPIAKLAETNRWLTVQSLALSFLVEQTLQYPSLGQNQIADSEWNKLVALVIYLQRAINVDELIRQGIRETACVIVDENYHFVARLGRDDEGIDFSKATLDNERVNIADYYHEPHDEHEIDEGIRSLVDSTLQPVNAVFTEQYGVDIDYFMFITYGLAYESAFETIATVLKMGSWDELVQRLLSCVIDVSQEAVENTLRMLILDTSKLREEGVNPRKLRERGVRLVANPLIPIFLNGEEKFIFGPHFVFRSLGIWHSYITSGTLPISPIPKPLEAAFQSYLNSKNKQYEDEVLKILQEAGLYAFKITDGQIKKIIKDYGLSLETFPGDIDVLVLLPSSSTILVLDVKRLIKASTPRQIRREYDKFLSSSDNVRKLKDKVKFVQDFWAQIAEYSKVVSFPLEGYRVLGAFVTDRVLATAYSEKIDFPIVYDGDLVERLNSFL